MSRNNAAKTRTLYTGEPYNKALDFVKNRGLVHGLIPPAQNDEQELLEAGILSTLAAGYRPHRLAGSGLAPYGLLHVSPDVDQLVLTVDLAALDIVVRTLLPRQGLTTGVHGLPGLRCARAKRHAVLSWPGYPAKVHILPGKEWLNAAGRLADDEGVHGLWTASTITDMEHDAFNALRTRLAASAGTWSTALRRLGLFAGRGDVDFASRLPTGAELAGPYPHRLTPKAVPPLSGRRSAQVVAFTSRKGGTGVTTIAANIAATLAVQGSRVLLLSYDWQGTQHAMFGTGDAVPGRSWRTINTPGQGTLAIAEVVPTADQHSSSGELQALVSTARRSFDYIVLDMPAAGASAQIVDVADAFVVVTTVISGPVAELPGRSSQDSMYDWLDDRFEDWLNDLPDEAYPDDDASEEEDRRWFDEQRTRFLVSITAEAVEEWGGTWAEHSAWPAHSRMAMADDSDDDQTDPDNDETVGDGNVPDMDDPRSRVIHVVAPAPPVGIDRRKVLGVVINRVRARDVVESLSLDLQDMNPFETTIPDSASLGYSTDGEGATILAEAGMPVARRFSDLAAEVVVRLGRASSSTAGTSGAPTVEEEARASAAETFTDAVEVRRRL